MSSRLLSLNQPRTSLSTGQVSFHISTHGTCTTTGLLFMSPLTPEKGSLIIKRSIQKNVLLGSASGRKRSTAVLPSGIFQCGKIALSPPLVPRSERVSCALSFARISASDAIMPISPIFCLCAYCFVCLRYILSLLSIQYITYLFI